MERVKKKDMLQTVETLLRANDAILKTVSANPQGASEALAQCQESAILLGNYIDTLGEAHADLVRILEDYCENIYRMSENLSDENACRKLAKKIRKQLIDLQNGIQYDLPQEKKEVVFLPYKASMWDSLESVWKAADADENTDAYVIPIPYFDKNPDGSFKEEHYEGDQYPKYVPITRYDEYDLKTRRPDAIYIHNPYDECNYVTSVHPYFYSKNLKNFTDQLIYIPYFILEEIDPDDQAAIDSMKHFCFTPGTIYADQVIVQSEKMRQIYINEYRKAAKEMELSGEHTDREFLEKKFLGTGSPKIDKVLNTKKEDLEIPEEWLRIIEKPDGSRKKIVFYNTSVSALLQNDEKMLRKMESVFEIFRENRDEVALLWRPHPLIRATIESMRPQLWEAYQELRDRYIEDGWGIYDDTADMDRAVVMSDAYYGDPSSIVQLYEKKSKIILIQNAMRLSRHSSQCFLNSFICKFIPDYGILLSETTNAIILFSARDWKIEKIFAMNSENFTKQLYLSAFSANNKLILIPYHANEFGMIDLKTGVQTVVDGFLLAGEKNIKGKFMVSVACDGHLWIIGENVKRIIGIEIDSMHVFANIPFKDIHGLENISEEIVWGLGWVIVGDEIWIASRNYGIILSINNITGETLIRQETEIDGFSYFYKFNEQILAVDKEGNEYQYESKQSVMVKTGIKFDGSCWKCIVVGDKRYYFEAYSGKILRINEDGTKITIYESASDIGGVKFQFVEQQEKYIYFQETFSGQIFKLDTDTDYCKKQNIDITIYEERWRKETIESNGNMNMYDEDGFITIESLLPYL